MRGLHYTTDDSLPEHDLMELVDALAVRLYERLGQRVYLLSRHDIAELLDPLIDDLSDHDRRAVPWLIWDLFQEGMALEFSD